MHLTTKIIAQNQCSIQSQRIGFGIRFAKIRRGTFVSGPRGEFVARSACNGGFVSILTLYHRRTSPEISNRPREFAWELWERHDKHQTQEYPMYALAYCAGETRGVFRARSRGRKEKREKPSWTSGLREMDPLSNAHYVQVTLPRPIVLAIVVRSLALNTCPNDDTRGSMPMRTNNAHFSIFFRD